MAMVVVECVVVGVDIDMVVGELVLGVGGAWMMVGGGVAWGCVGELGVGVKSMDRSGRGRRCEGLTAGDVGVWEELWDKGEGDMSRRSSTSLSDFSSMSARPVSSGVDRSISISLNSAILYMEIDYNPGQNIWQKWHFSTLSPTSMLFAPVRLFLREDLTENSNIDIKGAMCVPKN